MTDVCVSIKDMPNEIKETARELKKVEEQITEIKKELKYLRGIKRVPLETKKEWLKHKRQELITRIQQNQWFKKTVSTFLKKLWEEIKNA